MLKKLILGAVLGGLVAFGWGALSWMLLPWHGKTLKTFKDEVAVAKVVRQNAPEPGMYLLLPSHWNNPTSAQQSMSKGFMLFGAVRHEAPDMNRYYLRGLAIEMLGALFIGWFILLLPPVGYWSRVRISAMLGLAAGVLARLPDWTWWSFSTEFTLTTIVDLTMTWFLAGLVIAAFVKRAY